jgi:hypothetical protein
MILLFKKKSIFRKILVAHHERIYYLNNIPIFEGPPGLLLTCFIIKPISTKDSEVKWPL